MKEAKYKVGDKVIVKAKYDINPETGEFYEADDYLYSFPNHMMEASANIIWDILSVRSSDYFEDTTHLSKKITGDCAKYSLCGSYYSYNSAMFENGR